MTTLTFDTRKAVQKLQAAGVDDAHANAIVDTMAEAFGDTLATKADLAAAIDELKADMLKVAIGIVAANVTLTVALIKLL